MGIDLHSMPVVRDLGVMAYRQSWAEQEKAHEMAAGGGGETIFVVEHPPVVTLGRRGETPGNLLTPLELLNEQGVELVHSDRGGDITFHGPGQIVAYPIIRLADHGLSVSGYVHKLEAIVIGLLAELGISAGTDPQAVGVWADDGGTPAKICAIGVRIRRGVSLHGLALNATIDLSGFKHIVPCGLARRPVTSIARMLGESAPPLERIKSLLAGRLQAAFDRTAQK